MYPFVLFLHSVVRWLVVVLALAAVGLALYGWLGKKPWTIRDDRLGLFYTVVLDLQLTLGVLLYVFLSPITQAAFQDFGAAMKTQVLRYWAIEHIVIMIVAVALAHVGRVLSKKANGPAKFQRAAIFFGLSLVAILAAMPWDRLLPHL